jgi:hypothetical protein
MRAQPRGGKCWIAVRCSTGAAVIAGPQHGARIGSARAVRLADCGIAELDAGVPVFGVLASRPLPEAVTRERRLVNGGH